jgi:hypothetical protein
VVSITSQQLNTAIGDRWPHTTITSNYIGNEINDNNTTMCIRPAAKDWVCVTNTGAQMNTLQRRYIQNTVAGCGTWLGVCGRPVRCEKRSQSHGCRSDGEGRKDSPNTTDRSEDEGVKGTPTNATALQHERIYKETQHLPPPPPSDDRRQFVPVIIKSERV